MQQIIEGHGCQLLASRPFSPHTEMKNHPASLGITCSQLAEFLNRFWLSKPGLHYKLRYTNSLTRLDSKRSHTLTKNSSPTEDRTITSCRRTISKHHELNLSIMDQGVVIYSFPGATTNWGPELTNRLLASRSPICKQKFLPHRESNSTSFYRTNSEDHALRPGNN